jgi:hypothetical protein
MRKHQRHFPQKLRPVGSIDTDLKNFTRAPSDALSATTSQTFYQNVQPNDVSAEQSNRTSSMPQFKEPLRQKQRGAHSFVYLPQNSSNRFREISKSNAQSIDKPLKGDSEISVNMAKRNKMEKIENRNT